MSYFGGLDFLINPCATSVCISIIECAMFFISGLNLPNAASLNTVPHAVLTPTTTLFSLLLHNCTFASVRNLNVHI